MKVGIALPTMAPGLTRDDLLAWMRAADEGPFSVVGVGERIGYPNQEIMTTLAAVAAVTERVRVEATVSVAPMHPPVQIAKQAATIDVISGGRFVLGVGVGGRDEDYRLLEAPFERRFARLDEQVALMRRVWAGEAPFPDSSPVGPAPVQPGGPPVLTAAMGPKSMARSAAWADGLAGFEMTPDAASIAKTFDAFRAAWSDAGRSGAPFLQTSGWYALGEDAQQHLRDYSFRYLRIFGDEVADMLAGLQRLWSPGAIRETLQAAADAGCEEFILVATRADVADLHRAAEVVASLG